MTKCEKEFIRGYACATADIIRTHDEGTIARDVAHGGGLTLKSCIKACVDEYDLVILRPLLSAEKAPAE